MQKSRTRTPGTPGHPRRSLTRRSGYLADAPRPGGPSSQHYVRPPSLGGQAVAVVLLVATMWLLTHPAVLVGLVAVTSIVGALAVLVHLVGRRGAATTVD